MVVPSDWRPYPKNQKGVDRGVGQSPLRTLCTLSTAPMRGLTSGAAGKQPLARLSGAPNNHPSTAKTLFSTGFTIQYWRQEQNVNVAIPDGWGRVLH